MRHRGARASWQPNAGVEVPLGGVSLAGAAGHGLERLNKFATTQRGFATVAAVGHVSQQEGAGKNPTSRVG